MNSQSTSTLACLKFSLLNGFLYQSVLLLKLWLHGHHLDKPLGNSSTPDGPNMFLEGHYTTEFSSNPT